MSPNVRMEIAGVRMDVPTGQPVVVLRELQGARRLPIWMGTNEATSIVFALQGIEPPRPLTHDLLLSVVDQLGRSVRDVVVHTVENTVFHAAISFDDGTVVDARASDALAIAARTSCPILCAAAVLDEAGLVLSPDGELREQTGDQPQEAEAQVREFRDFLDHVDPDDFQS
ncbi:MULTISPECIES: bifunctional nuclease family protein [Kocuria]|mgnify:FL=1|uniref:bifunctional nuclease family protein n=1 Tax=Kocuria TaxID=57493 RepID=UPI0011AAD797|nr:MULTISPECIES: bifunctional nuclease family protein [Kocuria]QIR69987.1 bifunctional nuclease family protein [Kocuria sp. KD4]